MSLLDGILLRLGRPRRASIASARPGELVTLRGVVVPRDLLESPLTRERCVYYQHTVEAWRVLKVAGLAGQAFWELAAVDEAIVEFYLNDRTSRAIVSPAHARVQPGRMVGTERVDVGEGRRGQQLLIRPGDHVSVTGEMARADDLFDEGRSYRQTADRALVRAPAGGTLSIRLLRRGG